jgi:hypothetical protein
MICLHCGIDPPFGLDRMSDRLVVRELKKSMTNGDQS